VSDTALEAPKSVPSFLRTHVPPGDPVATPPHGARARASLVFSTPEGYRPLELDLFVPETANGPVPCVVWIHGGGFMLGSRLHLPSEWPPGIVFQALVDAGLAVASIDYRHADEAPFPAQLHDAKAAIRYLRRYASELGIDPGRMGVWGESAGAQLASLVGLVQGDPALEGREGVTAESSEVDVVVDFYGVADLSTLGSLVDKMPPHIRTAIVAAGRQVRDSREVLLAGSPLLDAGIAASPVTHVRVDAPPFLIIHGDADFLVPIDQSERLYDALQGAGATVEFVRVPGAGHVFGGTDPRPQMDRAVAFLRDRLVRVGGGPVADQSAPVLPDFRRMPIADAVRWLAENGEPADPRTDIDTASLKRRFPHLASVEIADLSIDGPHGRSVPARLYRDPDAAASGRALVWVHGGAFIGGYLDMPESNWVALELAARGIPVLSVDYVKCLGDVHFPEPTDEVRAAWQHAHAHAQELFGLDPQAVLLGGASAGGNLTAGAVAQLLDAGEPAPAGLILVYPVVHPNGPEASAEIDLASPHGQLALNFAGSEQALRDPHAFAALGRVDGFPRTVVVVCEKDDLRPSGEAFARQLEAAGIEVHTHLEAGAGHGHINEPSDPTALPTIEAIVAWIGAPR
jgi:acetyl esterase